MDTLRQLPSVDTLLKIEATELLVQTFGRATVVDGLRSALDAARAEIMAGGALPTDERLIHDAGKQLQARFRLSLRPVINATGVIIHTNLGRAPLADEAIEAINSVAGSYNTLEFDISTGQRGKRQAHIDELAAEVMGAEAAMVVNNCAAAVMLALSALAKNREVIISRGQLVEIGGGFRVPDVMAASGAQLIEVGTTNRTRISDYENAITENTAMLMRAHASNFKMMGFTQATPLHDMAQVAHRYDLLCIDDLGSGTLLDTADFGLAHEPTVGESMQADVDIVAFSGDKLLGGPQAGILAGKADAINVLKRHPMARAMRVDKLTIAALVATLNIYRKGQALERIPVWCMIAHALDTLQSIAEEWASILPGDVLEGESTIGGGSLPGETIPTVLYSPRVKSAQQAQAALRAFDPPIIARIKDDRLLLDPRTVLNVSTVSTALNTINL